MLPSKSMADYMSEMTRLFPAPNGDNAYSLAAQSPYNSTINRSSSSADSTSPESYPDVSFRPDYNLIPMPPGYETQRPVCETPRPSDAHLLVRRQRPIVGRKIIPSENLTPQYERFQMSPVPMSIPKRPGEFELQNAMMMWQEEPVLFQETRPNVKNVFIEHKNYTNVFYELFPTDKKGYEFKTPVKTSPTLSSMSNISPTLSNVSSNSINRSPMAATSQEHSQEHNNYTNVFYELFPTDKKGYEFKTPVKTSPTLSRMSNISPTLSNMSSNSINRSPMAATSPMSYHQSPAGLNPGPGASRFRQEPGHKMCTFCRKNGETPIVYMTHTVKEKVGNKYIVSCPILRSLVCSTCGASGDNAHTITYCPVLRNSNNGQPLQSTTITLKNTRIKSNGRRRY